MPNGYPPGGPAGRPRREVLQLLGQAGLALGALGWPRRGAGADDWRARPAREHPADVATAWFDHMLPLLQTTAGFSPPVASRALGYAGVALYEAVVPGMPGYRSLAGQLKDLAPGPPAGDLAYHWPIVASAALGGMVRHLFPAGSPATRAARLTLETTFAAEYRAAVPAAVLGRSLERGFAVSDHIFAWSKTDGFQRAPAPFTPPTGPGLWVPTPPGLQPALLPAWGANRPFVLPSGDACPAKAHVPFSVLPRSDFFGEARRVYDAVNHLTPEQRAIALFWSDDPGNTPTPPGHSVSILTQLVRTTHADLGTAAEAYARLGMAVADAFIACWDAKYRVNLIRPVTYIQRHMDPAWTPVLTTPPFPEHPSGHSTQSGAAAEVLTEIFGKVGFTDRTHEARGLPPREFGSVWQAAREAAISRLYGGIHYMGAIVAGLEQGRCIGAAVNALRLRA